MTRNVFSQALLLTLALNMPGRSQESSLFRSDTPAEQGQTALNNSSWIHVPLPPPAEVKIHDIITIRVLEKALVQSDGSLERRKTGTFSTALTDWIRLVGLKAVKPAEQADGDPTVAGNVNAIYRAEGDLETQERLEFNIAAHVVDIRPNGNLILEARRALRINNEHWEYSLRGECRKEDILPNNTVLSEDIADMDLFKRERGAVRDSYRRGWLLRWYDEFKPY